MSEKDAAASIQALVKPLPDLAANLADRSAMRLAEMLGEEDLDLIRASQEFGSSVARIEQADAQRSVGLSPVERRRMYLEMTRRIVDTARPAGSIGARFEALAARGQAMLAEGASVRAERDPDLDPAEDCDVFRVYLRGATDGKPFAVEAVLIAAIAAEESPEGAVA